MGARTVPHRPAWWIVGSSVACLVAWSHAAEQPAGDPADAAQPQGPWQIVARARDGASDTATIQLDEAGLLDVLAQADGARGRNRPVLALPMPDGTFVRFRLEPAFDPERTPPVRKYRGQSAAGSQARIEWSARGVHAVVRDGAGVVHVDPVPGTAGGYTSYFADSAGRPQLAAPGLPLAAVRQIEALMAEKVRRTPAQRKVGSALLDALRIAEGREVAPGVAYDRSPLRVDLPRPPVPGDGARAGPGTTAPGGGVRADTEAAPAPGAAQDRPPIDIDGSHSADHRDAPRPDPWPAHPGDAVLVDIYADVTSGLLEAVAGLGGAVVDSLPEHGWVRARIPLNQVETLAERSDVRRIDAADRAATHAGADLSMIAGDIAAAVQAAGSTTSEGDRAHDVPTARAEYGVDGTGIGIGVLSDGIGGLADRQARDELPEWVIALPGEEGEWYQREGSAMLEIVHDLAPGAHLYFATAFGGQARFAANIGALCEAGADVIVDDVFYLLEPAFQDGTVAKAVNAAADDGCFVFSAAGNGGNLTHGTAGVWEGEFAPADASPLPADWGVAHDFGDGDTGNRIAEVGNLVSRSYLLKWADPLGAAANDYDLYLLDESLVRVMRSSTDAQDGDGQPVESLRAYRSDAGAHLVVVRASGEGRYLRLNNLRGELEHATAGHTFGHAAARGTVGVAAVDALSAGGGDGAFDGTETVEPFSSDGPRRMFFEPDGAPVTPGDFSASGGKVLAKPDLAAADNVATSTPGFQRFVGTSAAAPHAAALGALMLEAAGGPRRVGGSGLRDALAGAALDIEAPGADRDSGAGIPMAPAAVAALAVDDPNAPPAGELEEAITLGVDGSFEVDLAPHFADPDGDALTYSLVDGNEEIATAVLTGTVLRIDAVAPGATTVFVRAADTAGLSVVRRVAVEVERPYGETDYDADDDGLIEIATLEQLDAVRYDLDADGRTDTPGDWRAYFDAFAGAQRDMGCAGGCRGFELVRDLDFGDPASYAGAAVDRSWSRAEGGPGWDPIGTFVDRDQESTFRAVLDGNGHRIAGLHVDRPETDYVGLFGATFALIEDLRLVDVDVAGARYVGGLVGYARTPYIGRTITGCLVTGKVEGVFEVGGLLGRSNQIVEASFSTAAVTGTDNVGGVVGGAVGEVRRSFATGTVSGESTVGGLVGLGFKVVASYAAGRVEGRGGRGKNCGSGGGIGGLAGTACFDVFHASYATGRVAGSGVAGGLVGTPVDSALGSSYWDAETSGSAVGVGADDADGDGLLAPAEYGTPGVAGKGTAELAAPTGYDGIYADWNRRMDHEAADAARATYDPWDFGDSSEYPALKADWDGDGTATWQEFGYQIRRRPDLAAVALNGQVSLTWTTVDTSPWSPPPAVTYAVFRNELRIAAGLADHEYVDTPPADGTTAYAYQVAVTVLGGEAARSNIVRVGNRAPPVPPVANRSAYGGAAFRYRFPPAVDPDGDAVAYAAAGLPDWLAFAASTRTFAGTPPEGGAAAVTITVTATDGGTPPLSSAAPFSLTVNERKADNRSPETVGTLSDVDGVTGDVFAVDPAAAFRDPDSDALHYEASSSDPGVATAAASGDIVEVVAVGVGRATVTVTAGDGALAAEQTFGATVANAAPVAREVLPDRWLSVPGEPLAVSVADAFFDAEGDALSYAVRSTDAGVVASAADGATVELTPVAPGVSEVTVTATDAGGPDRSAAQSFSVEVGRDYDADDDGLIDIGGLAQLDAVRHDRNGDGRADGAPTPGDAVAYESAFPSPARNMGCGTLNGCTGYELTADLDFDTDGSGVADAGDAYWNGGRGWAPIGQPPSPPVGSRGYSFRHSAVFRTVFEGNGRTVANLFIDRGDEYFVGLFGIAVDSNRERVPTEIRNVALVDVDVTGCSLVGGLVGTSFSIVSGSRVSGRVAASADPCVDVGGLAGESWRSIRDSHSVADVSATSHVGGLVGTSYGAVVGSSASGRVEASRTTAGGLVGEQVKSWSSRSANEIRNSWATGAVTAPVQAGGLVGRLLDARIETSYATGSVSGGDTIGGLAGFADRNANVVASFAGGNVVARADGAVAGGLVGSSGSEITAGYATGRILAMGSGARAGGLVGVQWGDIADSYATGGMAVSGPEALVGGLVGSEDPFWRSFVRVRRSYWDTRTSGLQVAVGSDDDNADGRIGGGETATPGTAAVTTAELQAPRGYEGIFAGWNEDGMDHWDFGDGSQYPVLKADMDGDGLATWQEFGHQLREGPQLTVAAGDDGASLAWTGVDAGHWNPPPGVRYRVYRDGEAIDPDTDGAVYDDEAVAVDYQVAAVVGGAEASRSAKVPLVDSCHAGTGWGAGERCRIEFTSAAFEVGADGGACVSSTCSSGDALSVSMWIGHVRVRLEAERGEGGVWTIRELSPHGPNRAPVALAPPRALLMLELDGEAVDLRPLFDDPDGDELVYEVASSAAAIATPEVSGPTLEVAAGEIGAALIRITARDPAGLAAEQSLDVEVVARRSWFGGWRAGAFRR